MRGTKTLVALTLVLAALAAASWWFLRTPSVPVSARESAPAPRDAPSKRSDVSDPRAEQPSGTPSSTSPAPDARANDATPSADAIAARAKELASVAATFRTEQPDLDALRRIATELASQATIEDASVRTDDAGVRRGAFTIPGTSLRGTFAIDGDRYDVSLPVDALAGRTNGFARTELAVAARDENGAAADARVMLQFHPDTSSKAGGAFAAERIVGWTASANGDGTVARATTATRLEDGAWRIGRAEQIAPITRAGDRDTRANDAWLAKLRPYAKPR